MLHLLSTWRLFRIVLVLNNILLSFLLRTAWLKTRNIYIWDLLLLFNNLLLMFAVYGWSSLRCNSTLRTEGYLLLNSIALIMIDYRRNFNPLLFIVSRLMLAFIRSERRICWLLAFDLLNRLFFNFLIWLRLGTTVLFLSLLIRPIFLNFVRCMQVSPSLLSLLLNRILILFFRGYPLLLLCLNLLWLLYLLLRLLDWWFLPFIYNSYFLAVLKCFRLTNLHRGSKNYIIIIISLRCRLFFMHKFILISPFRFLLLSNDGFWLLSKLPLQITTML